MPPPAKGPLRLSALALAATLCAAVHGACDGSPEPAPQLVAPGRTVDPAKPWSRAELGVRPDDAKSAAPAGLATVDPLALADLLRAVPTAAPGPTDPDGGTLIGTDTGAPATASPVTTFGPPKQDSEGSVRATGFYLTRDMATPAIERESRAQLYYPLVMKCKDKDGKILPPDAVLLQFDIDPDGYIVPASIGATPAKPEFTAAADCMRHLLAGLPFRGPPGARKGKLTPVKMTAPSVD